MSYMPELPKDVEIIGPDVAYNFGACPEENPHEHGLNCIWVWHNCQEILGEGTISPGEVFGWRPGGVQAHELLSLIPLTLSPSIYWPECCGKHGFITNGVYTDV